MFQDASGWLDEVTKSINVAYEISRADNRIAGDIVETFEPKNRLPGFEVSWDKRVGVDGGRELNTIIPQTQIVKPVNVMRGFSLNVGGYDGESAPFNFAHDIARHIAMVEAKTIISNLSVYSGCIINTEGKEEINGDDLRKVGDWFRKNDHSADTLIIKSPHSSGLVIQESSPHEIESLGADGLNVFHSDIIGCPAIIYERREIQVRKTALMVWINDRVKPAILLFEKWCTTAPRDNRAVVKMMPSDYLFMR